MSNHVNSLLTVIDVANPPKRKIFIGHVGENEFRKILFLVDSWREGFPNGSPELVFKRADGKTYPVSINSNTDGNPVFIPSSTETAFAGDCVVQLRWMQNDVLGKTCDLAAYVESAIGSVGPLPDDDVRDYEAEISANTNARHIHSNKNVLDGITAQKVSMWDEGGNVDKAAIIANTNARHTHNNKNVLDGITAQKVSKWDEGGNIDSELSSASTNPVQNKVVKAALDAKADASALAAKQDALTAGQNVTISGNTISADVDSAEIASNVTNWLDANVDPVGSAVVVDSSLSIEGAAADAKAVGDALDDYTSEPAPTESTGVNLYDPDTMTENKVITENGISASPSYKVAMVPVTPGKKYSAQAKTLAWNIATGMAFVDSNGDMLYYAKLESSLVDGYCVLKAPTRIISVQNNPSSIAISRDTTQRGVCFEVPATAAKVAFIVYRSGYDSRSDFMLEEGTTCSEYVPYASQNAGNNIATLHDLPLADSYLRSVAVKKTDIGYAGHGKNLFDISSMVVGGYSCNTDSFIPPANDKTAVSCAVVPVEGVKQYSIQRKYASWQANGAVVLLDENWNQLYAVQFISDGTNGDFYYPSQFRINAAVGQTGGIVTASADSNNKGISLVTSDATRYLAFMCPKDSMDIQVEEGGTCTAYEAYNAAGSEISSIFGAGIADTVAREALGIYDGGSAQPGGKRYAGMEWVSIGDSITVGGGSGGGYYTNEIANDLGFTHINAAESGVPYNAILTQANEITSATRICTVMLGTNNSAETDASIGQLGDTTRDTIYGCIYMGINKILTEHPGIILGIIVPVPRYRTAAEHESVRKVAKAVKESCEYYCIPCLDLHGSIGFAEQVADVYYMSDHIHPSAAGAHRMALAIEQWMISLLG